jgi:kanamycin kinase
MRIDKKIFPSEIQKIIGNSAVESDDVGRSGALVAFIGDGLVLKKAEKGKLKNANLMQSFFHKHDLAPEVIHYSSDDSDYLISARAEGTSAIAPENLRHTADLAGALGEFLLRIHSLPADDCPVQNLTDNLYREFDGALKRNEGVYGHISDYIHIRTAQEAKKFADDARPYLKNDTVLHGDYCLPNIMLCGMTGKHIIDVGEGGTGDRHFDLFWGLWSLSYNLKTDVYRSEFINAYGKSRIDDALIHACGCLCAPI